MSKYLGQNLNNEGKYLKSQTSKQPQIQNNDIHDSLSKNEIRLNEASLNDSNCLQIAQAIKENLSVLILECKNGFFIGKGLKIVSEAIGNSQSLKKINFSAQHITEKDQGFQSLCLALVRNQSIIEVDLSNNYLGIESTLHLSEVIKSNSTIQTLDLRFNNFGKEGCYNFIDPLKKNSTIINFLIGGNGGLNDSLKEIERIIEKNKKIRSPKHTKGMAQNISDMNYSLNEKYSNLVNEHEKLIKEYNMSQKEAKNSLKVKENQINELNQEIGEYNLKINRLNEENLILKKELYQIDEYAAKANNLNDKIVELLSINESQKNELDRQNSLNENLNKEIQLQEQKTIQLTQTLDQLTKDNNELVTKNENNTFKIKQLDLKAKEYMKNIKGNYTVIDHLVQEISDLQTKVRKLNLELSEKAKHLEDKNKEIFIANQTLVNTQN